MKCTLPKFRFVALKAEYFEQLTFAFESNRCFRDFCALGGTARSMFTAFADRLLL